MVPSIVGEATATNGFTPLAPQIPNPPSAIEEGNSEIEGPAEVVA
jgi:hypothetical protein